MTQKNELNDAVASFLVHLSDERQLSPHTITNYRRDLTSLLDFLEQEKISNWRSISSTHLRNLISQGHRRGKS